MDDRRLRSHPGERDGETAQLPVGLATIVTVIATFLLADALFTRRAGLWAALILITSYDFFANSQQVLPDCGRRVRDARGLVLLAGGEMRICATRCRVK